MKMRFSTATAVALLLATAAGRVVPSDSRQYLVTNITTLIKVFGTPHIVPDNSTFHEDPLLPKRSKRNPPDSPAPVEPDRPTGPLQPEWDLHVCRGEKLTRACKLDHDKAEVFMLPIYTEFKGTLKAERQLWGYTESPYPDCDIEGNYYDIGRAYEDLDILDEDTQCFRVFHYDPAKVDDKGNDLALKDQTYNVGGQIFRATGAHGTFGINVDEGVVFFIDVASASLKAADLWEVIDPPKTQLPALRQMSDLSWGFWHQAHGGSDLGLITKFIVPQIINAVTLRLIDTALEVYDLSDGAERLTAVPEWPGVTFDIETEAGRALLGSPNGIAAAYFLSQHKEEIGSNKYIDKITVFRPDEQAGNDEPTIVYYVENEPSPAQEENPKNPKSDQGLAARDLILTAETKTWHDYVCRGEKLSLACLSNRDKAVEFVNPFDSSWEGTMEADLKLWGYREESADSYCDFSDIETALKALKIGLSSVVEGGNNHCFQVRHSYDDGSQIQDQTYEATGKKLRMTDAHSIVGVNAVSGAIFFIDRKSAYHAAEDLWYPEIPTAETLPELRSMSDISWAFWNRVQLKLPTKRRNLGNINYFVVHNIVNKDTEQLIKQSLDLYDVPEGQQRVTELPKWPGLTFPVASEAGQAMLGSPNGIAAGYFLAQHKTQIGVNKYVYQVQIFESDWGSGPSMNLHVRDAPPPTLDDPELQEKRDTTTYLDLPLLNTSSSPVEDVLKSDRVSDEELWSKHTCRGDKLNQASIRNKDTAINFVSRLDSEFDGTMETEMSKWGYTDWLGESPYCDLDSIAPALGSLGIDARFQTEDDLGSNICFRIEHSRAFGRVKYKVDGKTYQKTGAYAHIGINPRDGVVSFLNVLSAESAARKTWNVKEPANSELPQLGQISDITWAFWNRAHPNGENLGNIKSFLVHHIINEDTDRLVRMALKSYQVPEDDQRWNTLPRWPGLDFDIATPEGKALLGSPNGLAAGYFLIQHKSQLGGNKHVHKATVWSDTDGDKYMLLWVKDAPPPPEEEGKGMNGGPSPDMDIVNGFANAGGLVKRSIDGKNLIREHRVFARISKVGMQ